MGSGCVTCGPDGCFDTQGERVTIIDTTLDVEERSIFTVNDAQVAHSASAMARDDGVSAETLATLRRDVLAHIEALHLPPKESIDNTGYVSKDTIRASHSFQRIDNLRREQRTLGHKWERLLHHFANGSDVQPDAIDPELVIVESDRETGDLFRLATLLWSVPVSRGFGRRIRYLVRDKSNGKLIGIFALGDPVFNLRARDEWIGWTVDDRRSRLVNIMDAYVVGAVPPYAQLLGGKLVASLIGSAEVGETFAARYGASTGIISGQQKQARLALVTVTSALGRSSLYNRLKLDATTRDAPHPSALVDVKHIGTTQGYGHFQLSDALFERLRALLIQENHAYGNGHQFGQGPNWRLRVARVALKRLDLHEDLLRHGIAREVYAMSLASNLHDFLRGRAATPLIDRPAARDIAAAALQRWVLPRAQRCPSYLSVRREQMLDPVRALQLPLPLAATDEDAIDVRGVHGVDTDG